MGQLLTKKSFSPQNELHTAKLCFSVVLKNFCRNSLKASLFIKKIDYPRKKLRNTQKDNFSNNFENGKARGKFGFGVNNCFCSKQ